MMLENIFHYYYFLLPTKKWKFFLTEFKGKIIKNK